jgi:hypothetical protein
MGMGFLMNFVFAFYEYARNCTRREQPGARALLAWCVNDFKQGAYNLGIYNCRTVRGKAIRSLHGEGRALDVGFRMINGRANPAGTRLVNALLPHANKLGIQMIIWNRTVWSRKTPRGARYTGVSPHYDHIHIELNWNAALNLNLATIRAIMRGAVTKPPPAPAPRPTPVAKPVAPRVDNALVQAAENRRREEEARKAEELRKAAEAAERRKRTKMIYLLTSPNDSKVYISDLVTKTHVSSPSTLTAHQSMLKERGLPSNIKTVSDQYLGSIPTNYSNAEKLIYAQGIIQGSVEKIKDFLKK